MCKRAIGSLLGLGSVKRDDSERRTLYKDSAGDQFCFSTSMHTCPRSEIFIWYILYNRVIRLVSPHDSLEEKM